MPNRVFVLLALLALVSFPLSAQQPPTPPEIGAAQEEPVGQTVEDLIPILDSLTKEQLLQKVNHVHNALGRDGQELLKAKAQVMLIQKEASDRVKRLEENASVMAANEVMESESAIAELGRIRDIPEAADRRKAFEQFMKSRDLSRDILEDLSLYKDAKKAEQGSTTTLLKIEEFLKRETIPLMVIQRSKQKKLAAQLAEIDAHVGGRQGPTTSQSTPVDEELSDALIEQFTAPANPQEP